MLSAAIAIKEEGLLEPVKRAEELFITILM
jgi:hypothetical protein